MGTTEVAAGAARANGGVAAPSEIDDDDEMYRGRSRAEWAAIRADYESNKVPLAVLYERYGLSQWKFNEAVKYFRWRQRRTERLDRNDIIERLFRLIDAQIKHMEKDVAKAGPEEVAVLGKMVANLGKLIEIENARPARRETETTEVRGYAEIKAKLVERIRYLKRS